MAIVLSVINEGEVFLVKEIDPRITSYLERNIEGLMIKTEVSQGLAGMKYITFPKGYKITAEANWIKIDFPHGQVTKGPIKIYL